MWELDLEPTSWHYLSTNSKHLAISRLVDSLEVSDKTKRMNAARCVLYLLQVSYFFTFFKSTIIELNYVILRDVGLNVVQTKTSRLMKKKMYYFYINLVSIIYF